MSSTMTPSEIADWLEIEAETVGYVAGLAGDAPHLRQAAATIRELEARVNDRNQRLEDVMIDAEGMRQRLVSASANLKIATEALRRAQLSLSRKEFIPDELAHRSIVSALHRIGEAVLCTT